MIAAPVSTARSSRATIHGGVQRQRVLRAAGHQRAAHPRIAVVDVDVRGAGAVGRLGDRAHQRRVLELGVDQQLLARLQAGADVDRELGVGGEPGGGLHRGEASASEPLDDAQRARRGGASSASARRAPRAGARGPTREAGRET